MYTFWAKQMWEIYFLKHFYHIMRNALHTLIAANELHVLSQKRFSHFWITQSWKKHHPIILNETNKSNCHLPLPPHCAYCANLCTLEVWLHGGSLKGCGLLNYVFSYYVVFPGSPALTSLLVEIDEAEKHFCLSLLLSEQHKAENFQMLPQNREMYSTQKKQIAIKHPAKSKASHTHKYLPLISFTVSIS